MPEAIPIMKPMVIADVPKGTVRVIVTVGEPPERVWEALTEREAVRRWFGDLSVTLQPGVQARLDFGDGDFFILENIRTDAPRRLEYAWRFLGTGPRNAIAWEIEAQQDSCVITVTDSDPLRSKPTVDELSEGWTDFLERLKRHLMTGELTRYDWRRDFDGAIELPTSVDGAKDVLFAHETQRRWLPFGGAVLAEGETAWITDGLAPERFAITKVDWCEPALICFQLSGANWRQPTHCRLEIAPHGNGAILVARHSGWESISEDDAYRMAQRKRFGDLWIEVLQRARELVS